MSICSKCGEELVPENISNSRKTQCKKCYNEYNRNYTFNHLEKKIEINKRYNEKHKEEIKKKKKINMGKYNKTPKGKLVKIRYKHKRERELGFNPINYYFEGCESHHINLNDVIYVPYEINHCVYHNIHTMKNMEIVNTYAYFFLVMQNIESLNKIFISGEVK